MGKKGPIKKGPATTSGPQMSVTMREASTGKKHTNAKSASKLQHIKNIAMWVSRDANIPSLGAFFGHHLASSSETVGAPLDPSLFTCQRCESILHPGSNCTIRIEKNKKNGRNKGKKNTNHPQNNIVYTCHFCSHRNMKRGTSRTKSQPTVKLCSKSTIQKVGNKVATGTSKNNIVANTIATPLVITTDEPHRGKMGIVEINQTLKVKDDSVGINTHDKGKMGTSSSEITDTFASGPATPLTKPTLTLLESKMKKKKKNKSGSKKKVTTESIPIEVKSSNRRKRKSWTSLKKIADRDEDEKRRKLMNLIIPFSM